MTKEALGTRGFVGRGFTWVEDAVYVGPGALPAISASCCWEAAVDFARQLVGGPIPAAVIGQLDRLLLTLMIVELRIPYRCRFASTRWSPSRFSSSASLPRHAGSWC